MPPKRSRLLRPPTPEPHSIGPQPPSSNVLSLRKNEKWAAVLQYIYLFFPAIGVPDYTPQTLEDDLADSTFIILPKLMHKILYTCTLDRRINSETWELYLRKQHMKRDPDTNPLGTDEDPIDWRDITVEQKLDVLHRVTDWWFTNPTRIRQMMNDDDNWAYWRIEPIGYDSKKNAYWFIGGERLWIQRAHPSRQRSKRSAPKRKAPKKAKPAPNKQERQSRTRSIAASATASESRESSSGPRRSKRKSVVESNNPAKRRRLLGVRMSSRLAGKDDQDEEWQPVPDEWLEESSEPSTSSPAKGKDNVELDADDSELTELSDKSGDENSDSDDDDAKETQDGSVKGEEEPEVKMANPKEVPAARPDDAHFVEWETICVTLDDWNHFVEQFKDSNSSYEKALYRKLTKEIIPWVAEVFEERAKVFQKEVEEVVVSTGRKRSARLAVIENERERAKAEAEQKAEVNAKHDRSKRFEAREKQQATERERREQEREERRKQRELEEEEERARIAKEESLKASRPAHNDIELPNGGSVHPVRRTHSSTGLTAKGSSSSAESWELACEICHAKGRNIDDGKVIAACGECGKWQHTECHDEADESAGRPRRDWVTVDFFCKNCQKKRNRVRNTANSTKRASPANQPIMRVNKTVPSNLAPHATTHHNAHTAGPPQYPANGYLNGHFSALPPGTNGAAYPNTASAPKPPLPNHAGTSYAPYPYTSYPMGYSPAYQPQYPPGTASPILPNGAQSGYRPMPTGPAPAPGFPSSGYSSYPPTQSYRPPPQQPHPQPNGQQAYWPAAYAQQAVLPGGGMMNGGTPPVPAAPNTVMNPNTQGGFNYGSPYNNAAQMLAYQAQPPLHPNAPVPHPAAPPHANGSPAL